MMFEALAFNARASSNKDLHASYVMVSKECLTNGYSKFIHHFSEIRAFKMHVLIAFSHLDPS